jgi:hypothetical protein
MSSPYSSPESQHHNDSTGGAGSGSASGGGGSATRATTRIKKRKPWSSLNLRYSIPGDVCIDLHASMAAWAQNSVSNMGGGSLRIAASSTTGTSVIGGQFHVPNHSTSSRMSLAQSENNNSLDQGIPENSPSRGPSYGTSTSQTPPRGAAIAGSSLTSDAHLPQLPRSPVVSNSNKSYRPHPIVVPPPPLSPEQLAHSGSHSGDSGRRPPQSYTSAPCGSPNDLRLSSPHSDNHSPSPASTIHSPPPRELTDHHEPSENNNNRASPLAAITTGYEVVVTGCADSSFNQQSRNRDSGTTTMPSSFNATGESSVRLTHNPATLPPLSRRFGSLADRGVSPVGGLRATSTSYTDDYGMDVGSMPQQGSVCTTIEDATTQEISVSGHEISKSHLAASSAFGDGESNGELPAVGLTIPPSSSTTGSDPARSRDQRSSSSNDTADRNDVNHVTTSDSQPKIAAVAGSISASIESFPSSNQTPHQAAGMNNPLPTTVRAPSANKSFKTHYLPAAFGGAISFEHPPALDGENPGINISTHPSLAASLPGSGSSSPSQTYSRVLSPISPGFVSPSASLSRVPTAGGVKMRTPLHPDYHLYDWSILDLVPQGAKRKVGKKDFPEYKALALKKLDDLEALSTRQNVVVTSPRHNSAASLHGGIVGNFFPPLPPQTNLSSASAASPSASSQQHYQHSPRTKQQQTQPPPHQGAATGNNYTNNATVTNRATGGMVEGIIGVSIGVASSSEGNSVSTLRSSLTVGSAEMMVTTTSPLGRPPNNSTEGGVSGGTPPPKVPPKAPLATPSPTRS